MTQTASLNCSHSSQASRSKRRKRLLVSAGRASDKERLLPAIRKILDLDVDLYATPGTFRFLNAHDVASVEIHKINDAHERTS